MDIKAQSRIVDGFRENLAPHLNFRDKWVIQITLLFTTMQILILVRTISLLAFGSTPKGPTPISIVKRKLELDNWWNLNSAIDRPRNFFGFEYAGGGDGAAAKFGTVDSKVEIVNSG